MQDVVDSDGPGASVVGMVMRAMGYSDGIDAGAEVLGMAVPAHDERFRL